jgi:hypothetical protein
MIKHVLAVIVLEVLDDPCIQRLGTSGRILGKKINFTLDRTSGVCTGQLSKKRIMRRFFLTIKELRSFRYSTKSGVVIQALLLCFQVIPFSVKNGPTTPHTSTGGLYPDGG